MPASYQRNTREQSDFLTVPIVKPCTLCQVVLSARWRWENHGLHSGSAAEQGGHSMSTVYVVPDQTLDCSGLACPMPILKTKKAIDALQSGQLLKVIATDPGSISDMEAFTRKTGNQL